MRSLTLSPIGLIRTTLTERVEAPRQPAAAHGHAGTIELFPGQHYKDALAELEGFERIWVLFWFDRNEGWRPKVLPPRSTSGRKGVFATRSPHRPNPLGLSALRLTGIDGLRLHVTHVDLLDGTPVLDIKPYIAYTDAWPDSASGWLQTASPRSDAVADPLPGWQVTFTPGAAAQVAWIEQRTGAPLAERIRATLALGPQPHAYRRIRRAGEAWQLAVRDWRAHFTVDGQRITVTGIRSGYRDSALARAGDNPAMVVHREYVMQCQAGPEPG
ncbi:MAG: tRNA (N6-threonylcarbamoyladenosine(37)-N6)-methyltransferase TrmO [Chromatiales bacterium]|nr:tRNA (N6-threonylcarbamoyladenosine(37)-N6)-methyltransferase TrmO [Chromatiales bacterium]